MNFIEKLEGAVERNRSLLMVGLDPQEEFLPGTGDIYTRLTDGAKRLLNRLATRYAVTSPIWPSTNNMVPRGCARFRKPSELFQRTSGCAGREARRHRLHRASLRPPHTNNFMQTR